VTSIPGSARAGSTPKAEETRRRILAAALDLFQEHGFAETTMREIARRARVATGAAYYYFPSKEAIVMAFYWQTHKEFDVTCRRSLAGARDLKSRVRALINLKIEQFRPYREFLGALFKSAGDPSSSLSPFSAETREIREESIAHFQLALEGSDAKLPPDLREHLPRLLWLYHMGIVLFWIYDRSPRQTRTRLLLEKSSDLIVKAIQLSRFRPFKPFRLAVLDLLRTIGDDRYP
jgi:AcrR family transcriptional regulator